MDVSLDGSTDGFAGRIGALEGRSGRRFGCVPRVGVRSHREPSLAEAQAVATESAAGSMI